MFEFLLNKGRTITRKKGFDGKYLQVHPSIVGGERHSHITWLDGSRMYVNGGRRGAGLINDMRYYDFEVGQWTSLAPTSQPAVRYGAASAFLNGKLYMFGGANLSNAFIDAHVYDPATNAWSPLANMPGRRYYHRAVAIGGFIYILGGFDGTSQTRTFWRYDPVTNSYATLALDPYVRHGHVMVEYKGNIIVYGGVNGGGAHSNTYRYNLATDSWTLLFDVGPARAYMGQGVVHNDRLYFFGGYTSGTNQYNDIWEFDLITNTWKQLPSGASERHAHDIILYNEKMYMFAGHRYAISGQVADLWEIT